jgi:hypothetical protein
LQVGNIGGREFAESLAPDVQKLLVRDGNNFEFFYWHILKMIDVNVSLVFGFRFLVAAGRL